MYLFISPNTIEEFQALIEELKNQSLMTAQHLEERMTTQAKVMVNQVRAIVEQTRAIAEQAKVVMEKHAKTTTE